MEVVKWVGTLNSNHLHSITTFAHGKTICDPCDITLKTACSQAFRKCLEPFFVLHAVPLFHERLSVSLFHPWPFFIYNYSPLRNGNVLGIKTCPTVFAIMFYFETFFYYTILFLVLLFSIPSEASDHHRRLRWVRLSFDTSPDEGEQDFL